MGGSSRHGSPARGRAGSRDAVRPPASKTPARATGVPAPDRDRLVRLLEPVVRAMDMDLESVSVSTVGRRRLLRVIIDADGGVSLADIAVASRELSARLDRSDQMGEHPYTLEVSSPGVDRPLTQPRHWRRAIGRLVVVSLPGGHDDHEGNGGGPIRGRIVSASDRGVTLEREGVTREYPYAELGAGRVQVEFGRLDDPGGSDSGTADPDADDSGSADPGAGAKRED
jgi:ribosome maturation factor RimP